MTRRRDCPIMLAAENDPRLSTMPLAARWFWVALLRTMRTRQVSVFRFGPVVPGSAEIAAVVSMSEAEVEPVVAELLKCGLLEREADGALAAPFLRAAPARAGTSHATGLGTERPKRRAAPPPPAWQGQSSEEPA